MKSTKSRRTVLVQLNSLGLRGTELIAVDFAHAILPFGYDSVLIGPRDSLPTGPSLFDVASDRGVKLEAYDRPTTVMQGARRLNERARAIGADIVHIYGPWAARSAYWGPSLLGRRPLVLTDYEMALSPDTFTAPQLIIGTTYLLEEQADRYGPTTLISPPVDLSKDNPRAAGGEAFRSEFGLDQAHIMVVLIGRVDTTMKARGIEVAIEAMHNLGRDDTTLFVVGTGDAEARLRELAETVNAEFGRRAVIFTGARSDPRPAYLAADISIGMGGSASRALAFGNPLIVQGENGWNRIFTPHSSAGLFRNSFWSDERSDDPARELAGLLNELADDSDLRASLGQFGESFAQSHFGLPQMTERLADCYAMASRSYRARSWFHDIRFEALAAAYRVSGRKPAATSDNQPSAYSFSLGGRR